MATIGRPRNFEREIKILEMLRSRRRVLHIARELGVHRNTVNYIQRYVYAAIEAEDISWEEACELVIEVTRLEQME